MNRGRIPLLSLNELKEKLVNLTILSKNIKKPYSNFHWLKVFGKCFPLVKI